MLLQTPLKRAITTISGDRKAATRTRQWRAPVTNSSAEADVVQFFLRISFASQNDLSLRPHANRDLLLVAYQLHDTWLMMRSVNARHELGLGSAEA